MQHTTPEQNPNPLLLAFKLSAPLTVSTYPTPQHGGEQQAGAREERDAERQSQTERDRPKHCRNKRDDNTNNSTC